MKTLDRFVARLGKQVSEWRLAEWRAVATELAAERDTARAPAKKRGRPESARSIASQATNYAALAWQVKERMDAAADRGERLKIKATVREIMLETLQRENSSVDLSKGQRPLRASRVDDMLDTVYTEVRKVLKGWDQKAKAED